LFDIVYASINRYKESDNMEEKPFLTLTVGKPFPGEVPHREGAIMELLEIGLVVVIQYPELRKGELEAFHKGFKKYSYLESPTTVPIAVWIFDFPNPHGQIDAIFNARVVKKDLIDDFLDTSKGGVKNALQFFLLDGEIIRGMKLVGLHPEAMEPLDVRRNDFMPQANHASAIFRANKTLFIHWHHVPLPQNHRRVYPPGLRFL
jgi:hypothetical protein